MNKLSGHFTELKLSLWTRFYWVVECIHDNVANLISTHSIGNVGVFIVDIEEIHQVAAKADDF